MALTAVRPDEPTLFYASASQTVLAEAPAAAASGQGGEGTGAQAGPGGAGGEGRGMAAAGAAPTGRQRSVTAVWAPDMDFSKDHLLYPPAARGERVEGRAWLRCFVMRRDRVRDCRLIGESPAGYDFGQAAMRGSPAMRIRLFYERGRRVYDEWVIVTKTFNLDES